MLSALSAAPAGDESASSLPMADDMNDDPDGELSPELRMFAREMGLEGPKAIALKNFIHECVRAKEDGEYDVEL